jgi:transposase
MKAYSIDVRERVVRAVDQGRPRAEIVQLFGVSLATLKRYRKQRRDKGHVRPKAIPGRTPKKRAKVEAGLEAQLRAHDDATLEQHCEFWEQAHGEPVSRWTMSRAIKRLGWTRKQSHWVPASATRRSAPPGEHKPASCGRAARLCR